MSQSSYAVGQKGEQIAQNIFRCKGFEIKALNWRAGRVGEIDLIVFHPGLCLLVFVEVKTRKTADYGHPFEAVSLRKQAQIRRLAEAYLAARPEYGNVEVRFDVVGIYYPGKGSPADVAHLENAF